MSEAIMPSLKYQSLINPESHAKFIIDHDKRIEELEKHTDDIQEFKKLATDAARESHGALDISKSTTIEQKHDCKIINDTLDRHEKSIIELQTQYSGLATEEGIRRNVSDIIIHDRKVAEAERKAAANRRMKYILAFGVPIMTLLITAGINFFTEAQKQDKIRDIELIKTAIQEVIKDGSK